MGNRDEIADRASRNLFDIAIIGGGINGACLYHRLRADGYRVILVDKGDFASGTSQASAMMVWGGLLYLGCFDLPAVVGFSVARDNMIRYLSDWVSPCGFRFLPAPHGLLSRVPVLLALYFYWLLSRFSRRRPRIETRFPEKNIIARDNIALLFEEGRVDQSDARFVLHWIGDDRSASCAALNYCELVGGDQRERDGSWNLALRDLVGNRDIDVRARVVVNCAGVWTDRINAAFGIRSPYKHVFSKGVFLGMPGRSEQQAPLIFDMGEHNDVITSIPWGPIRLWGPTETAIADIDEGLHPAPDDIRFLLAQYNRCYRDEATAADIVSVRCGIRPLAVDADYQRDEYPLELSRRSRIAVDRERRWVSVYGSKLTGCESLAESIARRLEALVPAADAPSPARPPRDIPPPLDTFPGLDEKVPALDWSIEHEYCCTLEDYLRRRTNIAQWIPREGLGRRDENIPALRKLCLKLCHGDEAGAERQLAAYRDQVATGFDRVLARV